MTGERRQWYDVDRFVSVLDPLGLSKFFCNLTGKERLLGYGIEDRIYMRIICIYQHGDRTVVYI